MSNIVQHHRRVVILGDPGSGKTTLLRYLTLCFASAVLEHIDCIFEIQDWWDHENAWQLPDLGPVRLPLLLRISKYAEARNPKQSGNPDLTLTEYLARYFTGHLQLPYPPGELESVLRRCLNQGRCLVLLDGLDEIIDPADRRDIAANINRFAGTFGPAGLPSWAAGGYGKISRLDHLMPDYELDDTEEDFDKTVEGWEGGCRVPEDVKQDWKKRWKSLRKGLRARELAYELLHDTRYAHLGNRFVVTSRIAGYHFARVGGEFEHFTIRPMRIEEIELFLNKWCRVAEQRIAEYPDYDQIEQRAQREIGGIMKAVHEMSGVRRMAQNPLLLRILTIIHRNERHLPQRRIELYETATVTLLRDWNLERGLGMEVVIDEHRAMGLLGPVALWIHEHRPTGLLTRAEVENKLAGILAVEQGEDPENPSMGVQDAVEKFLDTVRQYSGIFVERGEGLFGFMHLTFEEYFTARQMVSRSTRARENILSRLHQPRWREPTLLAVGYMSKSYYEDTHDLLRAVLDHNSNYEDILHRDLLFTAACIGDSVNVAPVLTQEVARCLMKLYCDRRGAGRYRLLQIQIKEALQALNNEQGNEAVEAVLAEELKVCMDSESLNYILDMAEWLTPGSQAIIKVLEDCKEIAVLPRVQRLLYKIRSRNGNYTNIDGWDVHRDNTALADLLGALFLNGWHRAIVDRLGLPGYTIEMVATQASWLVFQILDSLFDSWLLKSDSDKRELNEIPDDFSEIVDYLYRLRIFVSLARNFESEFAEQEIFFMSELDFRDRLKRVKVE